MRFSLLTSEQWHTVLIPIVQAGPPAQQGGEIGRAWRLRTVKSCVLLMILLPVTPEPLSLDRSRFSGGRIAAVDSIVTTASALPHPQ